MRIRSYEQLPGNSGQGTSSTNEDDLVHMRPMTYYGDGPFDPPSSDDEDESLLGKEEEGPGSPGLAEMGDMPMRGLVEPKKPRPTALRVLLSVLVGLVALAAIIGIVAGHTYAGFAYHAPGVRKITMDHVFNGTFAPHSVSVNWVAEAGDGVFSINERGHIKLVDLKANTTTDLVSTQDIKDEHGNSLFLMDWKLSSNMKQILIKADWRKQWRWSSFGNYYVHDIDSKTTRPLIPPTNPSETAYATWSPIGDAIAFVNKNDLYIIPSASKSRSPIRVTTSGNASLFHGVPDWVYEEEVFSTDYALWWSPDSSKLAFLAFDETSVPEFSFPIYNPTDDAETVTPYTEEITMKYPKPGYNNPLVSVHVFDLAKFLSAHPEDADMNPQGVINATEFSYPEETLTLNWTGRHPVDNSIISEVAWVGNSTLLVKEVDRNADDGHVVLFELDATLKDERSKGRIVRKLGKNGEEGDAGWIESAQNIRPVPRDLGTAGLGAYLDIVPTKEGFNHIALFSSAGTDTPRFLTSGEWEVTNGIKGVDPVKGLVYFEAAKPSSIERHLYSVAIPTISSPEKPVEPVPLTDDSSQAYYSSSFSPLAGFHVLNYLGPGVPSQKIVKTGDPVFEYVLTTNERVLNETLVYEAGTITHTTFTSDGYELNVKEIRPPRMDDSGRTKYPVLFHIYGGPQSQSVDLRFLRDWHHYVACGLQYIVVIVDGRGTGFKGRKLRNPVKGNLGFFETIDQVNAARFWAAKEYVDSKRIGIWGWSYGGFMSSKVAEADAGIHSLAMAVAPVTSWRLYDSIYTERYMNLPELNPGGYVNASISNVTGFNNIDYLFAQGSGDDNVHFANSAHLLDMFTQARIRGFRFRMFTDSDHHINRRGGQREVYEFLTSFLVEKWGKGGRRRPL